MRLMNFPERIAWRAIVLAATCLQWSAGWAQTGPSSHPIRRLEGSIAIDGDLSDSGWQHALRIDRWFETNPGDNLPPGAANVGWLTYDDNYFYVALEFADPRPSEIRAPYGDHDSLSMSHDYGGIFIDADNDGKTAILFIATARGVQYDAISSDATGEDSTPDFFWDSKARITDRGWQVEMRIPLSTLRYPDTDPQTWGVMLYRNWPRNRRTQHFSERLERGVPCLVCQSGKITGLTGLRHDGHWLFAPYATARQVATPHAGPGSSLRNDSVEANVGVDAKWVPDADTALDLTINPDFSQVEADQSQISANERFALLYDEKRPFFLEGKDLFTTPIRAVYTRTVTDPDWGLRATGRLGTSSYTVLAANDDGGGVVVVPGATESSFANQDFKSVVGVARLRYDIGQSFVSFLGTARELHGDAYNRVFGPDFAWNPNDSDRVAGQVLFSESRTPRRPELNDEWDGRELGSHAASIEWYHSTSTIDSFAKYQDVGADFRADNGFVPQVGYRALIAEAGYTARPKDAFLSRVRWFVEGERYEDRERNLLSDYVAPSVGMDGGFNSFMRYRFRSDRVRTDGQVIRFNRGLFSLQVRPSQVLSDLTLDGSVGQAVDFANSRRGHGGDVTLYASVRPTDHLEFRFNGGWRWIDVDVGGYNRRLFTARALELRTTYTFNERAYLRVIGQYVTTSRNPSLYVDPVDARDEAFAATALFTYKLNWQSVLFAGYGDERAVDNSVATAGDDELDKVSRQWFLKVSYAFQGK
jgi:hypothetical protein